MWSTLALLLLFGAVIGTSAVHPECELYKVPKEGKCEKTIIWMVNSDKEALATCLEYFPTTLVEGKKDGSGHAHCTVTAAYTCDHVKPTSNPDDEVYLMFDKCYYFPKDADDTIPKYTAGSDDASKLCKGGKLSVFYSYSHAKFVGMKAHMLGIEKLWIGITTDGRMIEGDKKMMIKNLWKVVEGDYWNGDELKKVAPDNKGEYSYPTDAKYFFFRTRTDYVMGRWQGSFERTTDAMKATFACEFEAKFTAALTESYCSKLTELGIDTVFDNTNPDKSRCLFISKNKYTFSGKFDDMKNIKGCLENPSAKDHSAGMDDGTGNKEKYKQLKATGKLRLAGYFIRQSGQEACGVPKIGGGGRINLFIPWRHLDHHGNIQHFTASLSEWDSVHPRFECSDFPDKSTTMGMKNGAKIDMPISALAHAVCSIRFFQQCGNEKPCGSTQECTNKNSFQLDTNSLRVKQGFFTCACPGGPLIHDETESNGEKQCKWKQEDKCAWLNFGNEGQEYLTKNADDILPTLWPNKNYNDKLRQIIVRQGCTASVYPGKKGWDAEALLLDVGYGTHAVPQADEGTLQGDPGMGASAVGCKC